MNNQNAIDIFNKIDAIRKPIFEAQKAAVDAENWGLYLELEEIYKLQAKIWQRELDNAYPTVEQAVTDAIAKVKA